MSYYAKEVEIGRAITLRAGEAAMRYYRSGLAFEAKSDDSPVTVADRECERLIAAELTEAFPDDGLYGEEGSNRESRSGRRWIIDPIDGTRDFVRGNPMWATLIGLEDQGEVVVGFAGLPALGELVWAARGEGAWVNGNRARASTVTQVGQAVLSVNAFNHVRQYPWGGRLLEFAEPFWAVRSMGGCYDAMMVARGMSDMWIETSGKPWDFAPLKVIAEEAGARFFDFEGRPTIYGGNCVICAPGLEIVARQFIGAAG